MKKTSRKRASKRRSSRLRVNTEPTGINWMSSPVDWPQKLKHKSLGHDFRVLLQDHDFDSPS